MQTTRRSIDDDEVHPKVPGKGGSMRQYETTKRGYGFPHTSEEV